MKDLLKFITCGSVDDGKSTLIGHMLYDAKLIYADQKQALELDSKVGSNGGELDYSLLLDGLIAEREQGITIDVAYRYFNTNKRSFIVADTPGHEEYTRNMAVGASFADLAVILVDASKGVLVQTKRHTRICALMGIRHFVFAVNKMDLVNYDENVLRRISRDIRVLVEEYDYESVAIIPVSATRGDNITEPSSHMPWYSGGSLLTYLENIDIGDTLKETGFTMPVQRVCRPDRTFRGFQGQVESGSVRIGDEITVFPSGETAKIKRIINAGKDSDETFRGQATSIQLDREIDVSRGSLIAKGTRPLIGTLFTAELLWMDDDALVPGRNYLMQIATQKISVTVMKIKYQIDVNTGEKIPADVIRKNSLCVCDISTSSQITYDRFDHNPGLGSLILVDRVTHMTSACGVVMHDLRRSDNIIPYAMEIDRGLRENQKQQKAITIWLTGLSGSGKSTIANELEKRLFAEGRHTMILDGDNVRKGLNKNLGFTEADRVENIRRVAETARLMNDAGLIVLCSFVSPYSRDRQMARDIVGSENFIEIYVSTPLEECEKRDVKGLYQKARRGEIPNFTGISAPYEPPTHADISIDTTGKDLKESVDDLINKLEAISKE
ncbi:MAG: adenylyl-sulfate kinase [Lachnospiraceae bacterium]|nr:adenylyl-sulfate kinase [Lachnospiraceae bacterium]